MRLLALTLALSGCGFRLDSMSKHEGATIPALEMIASAPRFGTMGLYRYREANGVTCYVLKDLDGRGGLSCLRAP